MLNPRNRRLLLLVGLTLSLLTLTFYSLGYETPLAWAAGGGGAEADGGHGIPPQKIWDLIYRTFNFVVLFLLLFFVLKKPLSRALGDRRQQIAKTLADLESGKVEAERKLKEFETRLKEMDQERGRILAEYIKVGEAEKQKIIAQAQETAERIKAQAQITISQELKTAKAELLREVAEAATRMAEDLIKKNIGPKDQDRLVAEYIEKVVSH